MIDLAALQGIVNGFMRTPVTIRHHLTLDKDPENRTGDETEEWEPETTTVMGWFVDVGTHRFGEQGGASTITDRPILRVPVGTRIDARDQVTLNGTTWTVLDARSDATWPVMWSAELVQVA